MFSIALYRRPSISNQSESTYSIELFLYIHTYGTITILMIIIVDSQSLT